MRTSPGSKQLRCSTIGILYTLTSLLAGCSLTPKYEQPAVEAPAAWRETGSTSETTAADASVSAEWWRQYGSDELSRNVRDALARNNDLNAALQRIEQARAGAKIAGAGLYPTADGSVGVTRNYSDTGTDRADTSYRVGLSVAYEVDLWERNQASLDAATARVTSSAYDRDALALVVMSDTARTYLQVLNLRERQQIARDNLANNREVLAIVEARFREGATSGLEVAQQRTVVANAEAALSSLERQQRLAEDGLAVLRGLAPAQLTVAASSLRGLALPSVASAQPSELLTRRPDIGRAESDLIAANADIGVARAAFFPRLQLGVDPALAFSPGSAAVTLAASMLQPIFQGGRLEGELERTRARQAELAENYRKTVLVSFREVEDALVSVRTAEQRVAALTIATEAAREAYRLSRERYLAGAIDFLTLLNTQNSQLQAEDSLAQARLDQFTASIDLYKALGGGWQGSATLR